METTEALMQAEQPKPEQKLSVRIVRKVPWNRSYEIGDVLDLPMRQAKGLLNHGHAEALTNMERRKHGFLEEDYSGHRRLREHQGAIRHYEKTSRMIPVKIVRTTGVPGSFDVGTISDFPCHEGMRLVAEGWAEHLTKAERDLHGFR